MTVFRNSGGGSGGGGGGGGDGGGDDGDGGGGSYCGVLWLTNSSFLIASSPFFLSFHPFPCHPLPIFLIPLSLFFLSSYFISFPCLLYSSFTILSYSSLLIHSVSGFFLIPNDFSFPPLLPPPSSPVSICFLLIFYSSYPFVPSLLHYPRSLPFPNYSFYKLSLPFCLPLFPSPSLPFPSLRFYPLISPLKIGLAYA